MKKRVAQARGLLGEVGVLPERVGLVEGAAGAAGAAGDGEATAKAVSDMAAKLAEL